MSVDFPIASHDSAQKLLSILMSVVWTMPSLDANLIPSSSFGFGVLCPLERLKLMMPLLFVSFSFSREICQKILHHILAAWSSCSSGTVAFRWPIWRSVMNRLRRGMLAVMMLRRVIILGERTDNVSSFKRCRVQEKQTRYKHLVSRWTLVCVIVVSQLREGLILCWTYTSDPRIGSKAAKWQVVKWLHRRLC